MLEEEKKELKRKAEDQAEGQEDDEDDDWVGPMPSEAAPAKKQRVLEHEQLYLDNLPNGKSYEKSFMHRDNVTQVAVATDTNFIVTASCDGHIKFWKKQVVGIEFVKHFRAHLGNIQDLSINHNNTLLCTISNDKHTKIFDVVNFDMINILKLGFSPGCCQWVHKSGDALAALAITNNDTNAIHIYDGRGDPSSSALKILDRMHMKQISAMRYNYVHEVAISADIGGMIEYWSGPNGDYEFPKNVMFQSKLDTNLFELAKNKSRALNMAISPNGKFFVIFADDRKIRVFRFLSGKLYVVIDEGLKHYMELQQVKQLFPAMEFNRKIANEKDLEKADMLKYNNVIFDKTSNFIMYSSMIGIKVANICTKKISRVLGKTENLRFLNLSLYQGIVKQSNLASSVEIQASDNPALNEGSNDPTLVCTSYKKNRFYLLSRREARSSASVDTDRDVFNEKPSKEDIIAATEEKGMPRLFEYATIHSSLGDIQIQLFPRECPKTVENFCVHSKNGYYNGHIFHRVIKQFMVQTGDPTGIGTGGESIWGGEFEDEFHPKLRHDRPYTLSMANAGPNTNGSQFFITVVPTPWLDNKHTIFGRVVKGMEIIQNISNAKTHPKTDKPYDDITIVSVSVKNSVRL